MLSMLTSNSQQSTNAVATGVSCVLGKAILLIRPRTSVLAPIPLPVSAFGKKQTLIRGFRAAVKLNVFICTKRVEARLA